MRLLVMALLICCSASASRAEIMVFDVNLSGTSDLGNTLTVFGTLEVDPALPIDSSNYTPYNFFVQRNAETAVRSLDFLSLAFPNAILGIFQMEWSLLGNDLYVTRTSSEDSSLAYVGFNPIDFSPASFNLGSGVPDHSITWGHPTGSETAVLKGASGPDGPHGFLIGTAVIPEPSSLLLSLTGACLMGTFVRRKRA